MHFTKSIQSVNLVGCNPYNPLGRSEDGVKAYLLFKLKDDIQVCFSVEKKDLENQYTTYTHSLTNPRTQLVRHGV